MRARYVSCMISMISLIMRTITLAQAFPIPLLNNHLFLTGGKREVAVIRRTQPIKPSRSEVYSLLYQFQLC